MVRSHCCLLLVLIACTSASAADSQPLPAAPIAATAELAKPLAVGMKVPVTVAVQKPDGSATTLAAALDGKPTVVVFYRGGWCPYCTRHLSSLGGIAPQLKAAGWNILALVPDRPETLAKNLADAKGDGGIARLSDVAGNAMRAFGVAFQVDDETWLQDRSGCEIRRRQAGAAGAEHLPDRRRRHDRLRPFRS